MYRYSVEQLKMMMKLSEYHLRHHPEKQLDKLLEEFEELSEEIELYKERGWIITDALLNELFDVDFMMFQIKKMLVTKLEYSYKYNKIVNAKLKREIKRHFLKPD